MQTEEQIRKTEYAKALNKIKELENDIETLNRDNGKIRKALSEKEKQIDELESEVEDLESEVEDLKSQMEDQAMFTPNHKMSLIELMEIEEIIGGVTFT